MTQAGEVFWTADRREHTHEWLQHYWESQTSDHRRVRLVYGDGITVRVKLRHQDSNLIVGLTRDARRIDRCDFARWPPDSARPEADWPWPETL